MMPKWMGCREDMQIVGGQAVHRTPPHLKTLDLTTLKCFLLLTWTPNFSELSPNESPTVLSVACILGNLTLEPMSSKFVTC